MGPGYRIRKAKLEDLDTLVGFTLEEAREAEGVEMGVDGVRRGVRAGLEDRSLASYWVAESASGRVVASTSVVREWSDWHGAYYWWVQSLFIVPEHRGQGLVELLMEELSQAARAGGAVDLRLYVHDSNRRAVRAYERCGFVPAPYTVMIRGLRDG